MFSGLHELRELNVEDNHVTIMSSKSLNPTTKLRIARFSNNHLTLQSPEYIYPDVLGSHSPFHNCPSLEELYLANNTISAIFSDWMFINLKLRVLDLKYNNISVLKVSIQGKTIIIVGNKRNEFR